MPEEAKPDANGDVVEVVVPPPAKVTFTDEQQNLVNSLINDSFERAYKKATDQIAPQVALLKTELETLKKAAPATVVTTPPAKSEEKPPVVDPKIAELQARVDEMKAIADQLREAEAAAKAEAKLAQARGRKTRIKEEFIRAADKVDFFDRMDVFNLVEQQLELDDDNVVILNPATNRPRQSVSGNMSLDEFITDFVKTKPHMVRSKAAAGGTGAEETRKVASGVEPPVDYSKMTNEQFLALSDQVISGGYKR